MYNESRYYLTEEEFIKYQLVLNKYCEGIYGVKIRLYIKISILIFITLFIAVVAQVVSRFGTLPITQYGTWFVLIPMFFIGKNLGQASLMLGIAKRAAEELNGKSVAVNIERIEGCYLDNDFRKFYKRRFLKLSKRYILVTNLDEKYRILEAPDVSLYLGQRVKLIYTADTRIVLELRVIDDEKPAGIDTLSSDIEQEKLIRIGNRKEAVWSVRDIKMPCMKIKHHEKEYVYLAMDIYYNGLVNKKNDREINIICKSIGKELKEYIDEYEDIDDNIIGNFQEIISSVVRKYMKDIDIKRVEYDWVIVENKDKRTYIEL